MTDESHAKRLVEAIIWGEIADTEFRAACHRLRLRPEDCGPGMSPIIFLTSGVRRMPTNSPVH